MTGYGHFEAAPSINHFFRPVPLQCLQGVFINTYSVTLVAPLPLYPVPLHHIQTSLLGFGFAFANINTTTVTINSIKTIANYGQLPVD